MPVKNLVSPCLNHLKFNISENKNTLNLEGLVYQPPKELGEGYYWYYERENMFAISILNLKLKEDAVLEYQQQDFISINYYDTISAEELSPYKRINANCIRSHISNSNIYRARYHKTLPIQGIEIMLMPGYYQDYLKEKYPTEFSNPKTAFSSIDGITDFPQLLLLIRQLQNYQGTGIAAHLFYESKINEALSLIIEKTKKHTGFVPNRELSKDDLVNLDAVKCYIEDHFAFTLTTEQLCKIACMGQTKLRYSFKHQYGYTITEFIQNKRISHAEYMLIETDFSIAQIAKTVGYSHSGRFANLFKKITGLYPEEYRKIIKTN